MITPDDISIMTEDEKLEFLRTLSEAESWQDSFRPLYEQMIDDDSARVRAEAIAALWELADEKYIEPLMRKAENDPDTSVRARAASVLGIYIYDGLVESELDHARFLEVRKFLMDLASDPDEDLSVRRLALEALSFDPEEDVCDLIEWAYEHSSLEVRISAVFAMGRAGSVRWHDRILEELDSDDAKMKLEAVRAAGEAHLTEATPRLRSLTRHADRDIRIEAIWALSHTGGPGALETLEMCAQSEDEEIRRVAASAVDEFHFEASLDKEGADDDYEDDLYDE